MKPVSVSQTRGVKNEKMNKFTGKRRKQKATVKERILESLIQKMEQCLEMKTKLKLEMKI